MRRARSSVGWGPRQGKIKLSSQSRAASSKLKKRENRKAELVSNVSLNVRMSESMYACVCVRAARASNFEMEKKSNEIEWKGTLSRKKTLCSEKGMKNAMNTYD